MSQHVTRKTQDFCGFPNIPGNSVRQDCDIESLPYLRGWRLGSRLWADRVEREKSPAGSENQAPQLLDIAFAIARRRSRSACVRTKRTKTLRPRRRRPNNILAIVTLEPGGWEVSPLASVAVSPLGSPVGQGHGSVARCRRY